MSQTLMLHKKESQSQSENVRDTNKLTRVSLAINLLWRFNKLSYLSFRQKVRNKSALCRKATPEDVCLP